MDRLMADLFFRSAYPRIMKIILIILTIAISYDQLKAQVPLEATHWEISAKAHVFEKHKGHDAIYLTEGKMTLRNIGFTNGTITFDVFLKEERSFPGVFFREVETGDSEHFYFRTHLSGKPDANQATAVTKGVTPWQLYFGPRYSFPYDYHYDDWTHVEIRVNEGKAQVFLDHSEQPHLSWNLFHPVREGGISFQGGKFSGVHYANIRIDMEVPDLVSFAPVERKPIQGLVDSWQVSDKFEEQLLMDHENLLELIRERTWKDQIMVEEGAAANISRVQKLRGDGTGNTVLVRAVIRSDRDQIKLFEFGYSDRVVAILNGKPIYRGTNKWGSRDYRYLGTIGLFDGIYLDLKKGENELLMAVSEDFGGWLITGRFQDKKGIAVVAK